MNDSYAGDIGDFCKYGLLRFIINTSNGKKLGINWYRTDLKRNGKHYDYLKLNTKRGQTMRMLDENLYDALSPFRNREYRKIKNVEEANILPGTTITFNNFVSGRFERESWHKRALQQLKKADIIFLDPDNGIEIKTKPFSKEHVRIQELQDYYETGKTIILYNHYGRAIENERRTQFRELKHLLRSWELTRLWCHRGTARDFLFFMHDKELNQNLEDFLKIWGKHFEKRLI